MQVSIYHESLYAGKSAYTVTQDRHGHFQHHHEFKSLPLLLEEARRFERHEHVFLLDEERFDFFRFDITLNQDTPLTIQQIQTIVHQKSERIKRDYGVNSQQLFFMLDRMSVDDHPVTYVLSKTGRICFSIYFVFLKRDIYNSFRSAFGDFEHKKDVLIYPQSFYTIHFLKKTLKKDDFYIIRIANDHAKLVHITNGFYNGVEKINLGIDVVKTIYKENMISRYLYESVEEIEKNPYAKDLILKSLDFYSEMLSKRLVTHCGKNQDMILMSSLVKNQYFLDVMSRRYQEHVGGYILPFHYSSKLDTFGSVREPENMDSLIYVNVGRKKD